MSRRSGPKPCAQHLNALLEPILKLMLSKLIYRDVEFSVYIGIIIEFVCIKWKTIGRAYYMRNRFMLEPRSNENDFVVER